MFDWLLIISSPCTTGEYITSQTFNPYVANAISRKAYSTSIIARAIRKSGSTSQDSRLDVNLENSWAANAGIRRYRFPSSAKGTRFLRSRERRGTVSAGPGGAA